MNLMLTFIIACVTLGLLASHFGRREQAITDVMATLLVAVYYFVGRAI